MVSIRFILADGQVQFAEGKPGETLMECAKAAGVDGVIAECGGSMVCGTCHVYIAEPWFSQIDPPSAMETDILDYGLHLQSGSRLSCQIRITPALEGIEVGVPVAQR